MENKAAINLVMQNAQEGFLSYKKIPSNQRATFLRKITEELSSLGDVLIETAMAESNLPKPRLEGERGRTINQLLAFADLIEKGDWLQASIDKEDAERKPLAKPDIRKMFFPIGPVVVFGAANFPLAFSTAGGDTASALAAGCSVVVKCHPGHPKTSALVAASIQNAITNCKLSPFIFQHVEDTSIEAGCALVLNPLTKAASFTGSFTGGKALYDLANSRPDPIPFFAEMGSINPILLLPDAIKDKKDLAQLISASILQGVGQFCTNPGVLIVMKGSPGLEQFLSELSKQIKEAVPQKMLNDSITENYFRKKKITLSQKGISVLAEVGVEKENIGSAILATVSASDFISNKLFAEEVFGPFSLIVQCENKTELLSLINTLPGQLTATVFGEEISFDEYSSAFDALQNKVGRLLINNVPTGVEVCKSMHHGGPFPSATDSRFTSVGTDAIYRFVRPISFQNFPEKLLPVELRNNSNSEMLRCINGKWIRDNNKVIA